MFVVPFGPDRECLAGPSKPSRPLGELYDSLYERCDEAYHVSLLGLRAYAHKGCMLILLYFRSTRRRGRPSSWTTLRIGSIDVRPHPSSNSLSKSIVCL